MMFTQATNRKEQAMKTLSDKDVEFYKSIFSSLQLGELNRAIGLVDQLTPRAANHALHRYVDTTWGFPPGGAMGKLLDLLPVLDESNRAKMALGFPEYVAAYELFSSVEGGIKALRNAAKGGW